MAEQFSFFQTKTLWGVAEFVRTRTVNTVRLIRPKFHNLGYVNFFN